METDGRPGYVSPSQCSLYMGNVLLDDAASVEYAVMTSREAYFGYHNKNFSAVATGRSLTTGSVTIQFRGSGYLTKAIYKAYEPKAAAIKAVSSRNVGMDLHEYFKSIGKLDDGQALTDLATKVLANNPTIWAQFSKEVKDAFFTAIQKGGSPAALLKRLGSGNVDYSNFVVNDPTSTTTFGPVSLVIVYGRDVESPERAEVLEDVYFTSMAKRIDNSSAEMSGAPVMERYEFMCKGVRPIGVSRNSFSKEVFLDVT